MVNVGCLVAGIILLILGSFLLFTDAGPNLLTSTEDDPIVGIGFYIHFLSYTLFLSGIALVVRCFMKERK